MFPEAPARSLGSCPKRTGLRSLTEPQELGSQKRFSTSRLPLGLVCYLLGCFLPFLPSFPVMRFDGTPHPHSLLRLNIIAKGKEWHSGLVQAGQHGIGAWGSVQRVELSVFQEWARQEGDKLLYLFTLNFTYISAYF